MHVGIVTLKALSSWDPNSPFYGSILVGLKELLLRVTVVQKNKKKQIKNNLGKTTVNAVHT